MSHAVPGIHWNFDDLEVVIEWVCLGTRVQGSVLQDLGVQPTEETRPNILSLNHNASTTQTGSQDARILRDCQHSFGFGFQGSEFCLARACFRANPRSRQSPTLTLKLE